MNNIYTFLIFKGAAWLLLLSTLILSSQEHLKLMGYLSLALFSASLFIHFVSKIRVMPIIKFDNVSAALLLYFIFSVINVRNLSNLESIANPLFYLLVYIFLINQRESHYCLKYNLKDALFIFIISSLVLLLMTGFGSRYSFVYNNPNSYSITLFIGMMIYLISNKSRFAIVDFTIIAIVMLIAINAGTRSVLIASLIYSLLWILLKNRNISKRGMYLVFIAFMLSSLFGIVLYSKLYGTELGSLLNIYFRDYTDKNLFSGRQKIWNEIIESKDLAIAFFGNGTGARVSDQLGVALSSHNSFLQIYFQQGLIGLAIMAGVLFGVISNISKIDGHLKTNVFLSFLGILVVANFEVFIFQNHTVAATLLTIFMAWTFLESQAKGKIVDVNKNNN